MAAKTKCTPTKYEWLGDSVEVLAYAPGDTIVVRFQGRLSQQTTEMIASRMRRLFPGNPSVVLDRGASIGVLREDDNH